MGYFDSKSEKRVYYLEKNTVSNGGSTQDMNTRVRVSCAYSGIRFCRRTTAEGRTCGNNDSGSLLIHIV